MVYPRLELVDPAVTQAQMLGEFLDDTELCSDTDSRRIDIYTTAETYEFAAAIKRLNLEIDSLVKVNLGRKEKILIDKTEKL